MAGEVKGFCVKMIHRINSKDVSELTYNDFYDLRTGGRDKFSTMSEEKLKELISEETVRFVQSCFDPKTNAKNYLKTLRWIARGLLPQYAIRKIKMHEDIGNNKML